MLLQIIISFTLTAWITILVAIVPVLAILQDDFSRIPFLGTRLGQWLSDYRIPQRAVDASEEILRGLCDVQLLTGLSIVIAGLATMKSSTYYHQQMVISFWWLTLNSFWVARIELDPLVDRRLKDLRRGSETSHTISKDPRERHTLYDGSSKRSIARLVAVILSVVLGIFYQSWILVKQKDGWDSENGNNCFIYHDYSDSWGATWIWIGGLVLYTVTLLLVIFPRTRKRVSWWLALQKEYQQKLWDEFQAIVNLQIGQDPQLSRAMISFQQTVRIVLATALFAASAVFWLGQQFLAVVSYGDGWYPILLLAFAGFAGWTTWDIADYKRSNHDLVDAVETSWGFGQVLPITLLLGLALQFLDAFDSEP